LTGSSKLFGMSQKLNRTELLVDDIAIAAGVGDRLADDSAVGLSVAELAASVGFDPESFT